MTPRLARAFRRAGFAGLLLAGYAALVAAACWPWPLHWATHFARHWDPPFHAWKLQLVARAILDGRLLPEHFNSNCYYPSSLALYFEALHWPQSLLAAAILRFTDNAVLMYSLVHLLTWAFSGVCLFALLRELGARRSAAWLGGAIFCVIPYRMNYFVEFNMQQCFALPLFLLFLVRFLRAPSPFDACGMALTLWLQAVGELYQAVILLFAAPLIAAPLLRARLGAHLRNRRFYVSLLAGAAIGAPLSAYFLRPYLVLHDYEGLARPLSEIARHTVEPLSYFLRPGSSPFVAGLRVTHDETSVYPTLAVLALAVAGALLARRPPSDVDGRRCRRLRILRGVAAAGFAAGVLAIGYAGGHVPHRWFSAGLNAAGLTALLASLAINLRDPGEDDERRLLGGLVTASVFCFLMSLGPAIRVHAAEWSCRNLLFLWLFDHLSILGSMRVVSRFSVVLLLGLVIAAAMAWEHIVRLRPRWRLFAVVPLALVLAESRIGPPRLVPFDYPARTSVLNAIDGRMHTLLVLPFGDRHHDSVHMLQFAGWQRLMLYAWGGFYPDYQNRLFEAWRDGDTQGLADRLEEVWPPAWVLADRKLLRKSSTLPREAKFAARCERVADDGGYALYRVVPSVAPRTACERLVRTDYLRRFPVARFSAAAADPCAAGARLRIEFNGTFLAEVPLAATNRTYEVPVPPALVVEVFPNSLRLATPGGEGWRLASFEFRPDDAGEAARAAVPPPPAAPSPWARYVTALPPNATPASVRFPSGLRLAGFELPRQPIPAGGTFRLRTFWECPPGMRMYGPTVTFVHFRDAAGGIVFQGDHTFLENVPGNQIRCQPWPRLFVDETSVTVPEGAPAAAYDVDIGLEDMIREERLPGSSTLPARHDAFRLPARLVVGPGPERGAMAEAGMAASGAAKE